MHSVATPKNMKALFFTLVIFTLAFLGYDYFMAPPGTKVVFKSLNVVPEIVPAAPSAPEPVAAPKQAPPKPVATQTETEKPKEAPPAQAPVVVTPQAPKKEANGFAPPAYDPIEVLTGKWLKIPASAFPRPVKLRQEVQFEMGAGTIKMAAGAAAVVLGAEAGMLTVAPSESSPARAKVPVDGTDLKQVLNTVYEEWKPKRTAYLREVYAKKLAQMKSQGVFVAPDGSFDSSGMPARNPDGSYPLLLASMSSGQVTEITKQNIHSWGAPTPAKVEGKDGWSIKVNYDAHSIFGPMPVDAQAIVVSGKVKGWYYLGSGEEVP